MADDKQDTNAPKANGSGTKKTSPGKGARKGPRRKAAAGKPAPAKPAQQKTVAQIPEKADAAKPVAETLKAQQPEPKPAQQAAQKFAVPEGKPDELPAPDTDALKVEASSQAIATAKESAPSEPPAKTADAQPAASKSAASKPAASKSAAPKSAATAPAPSKPASKEAAATPAAPKEPEAEKPSRTVEKAPLAATTSAAPAPKQPEPTTSGKPSSIPPARKPNITQEFVKMTDAEMMTQSFQSAMAEMTAKSQDAYKKSSEMFKEAGEFTKGNLEAMMESTKIFAAGMQEMSKAAVADSKSEFEALTAEVKEMASVKSPTDFFQMQSALLRKNFDKAVAMSSKNTEAMLKLANDAAQPLSTRMSLAMEKIKAA
ncbi:phasin family protein [Croceicoccus marinus]|uniref:Phasin domain-containing protein n=1 Tax=Croceicoccus marinus TaxID=450378 RepID=A0A1Z1FCU1_9SPHN|nr:phasin family protein [Croceicoccus marinus]ARU16580.1 hypothetical protein A9D14_10800 [Croceicoccus marinus]